MKQLEKFIIDLRFKIAHFLFMTRFFLGTFFISVIPGIREHGNGYLWKQSIR